MPAARSAFAAPNRGSVGSASSSQPGGVVKARYRRQALREDPECRVLGERRAVPSPSVAVAAAPSQGARSLGDSRGKKALKRCKRAVISLAVRC